MKRCAYIFALGLTFATANAASQENPNPTQQGTPSTMVQQKPHPAQPPTQDTPGKAAEATSAASGTAGNATKANQQAATVAPKPSAPSTNASAGFFSNPQDAAKLQQQIQNAIRSEPTLSADSVIVSVTESDIDIGGNVSTSKDRQTARRIAQSFAGNRRVREHISVAGAVSSSSAATTNKSPTASANTNPSTAPAPNTQLENKPVTKPEQKGDASDRPR